ncbi:hypothetical protein FACS189449_01110 [Alphaproteobacteria bacterium]|nr:hypothetical protein FACS189449_01110 [Alphaproteobacteria bacterium]
MEPNKLIVACAVAMVMSSLGIADDVWGANWHCTEYDGTTKSDASRGLIPHGKGRGGYGPYRSYAGDWVDGKWHGVGRLKLGGLQIEGYFENGRLSYGEVAVHTMLLMRDKKRQEDLSGEYSKGIISAKSAAGNSIEYRTDDVINGQLVVKDASGNVICTINIVDGRFVHPA